MKQAFIAGAFISENSYGIMPETFDLVVLHNMKRHMILARGFASARTLATNSCMHSGEPTDGRAKSNIKFFLVIN